MLHSHYASHCGQKVESVLNVLSEIIVFWNLDWKLDQNKLVNSILIS